MRDVASERDERGITIQRVGVRGIHLPVMIREKSGGLARVVGQFDASVELPHYERGTHMSRFVEILAKPGVGNHVRILGGPKGSKDGPGVSEQRSAMRLQGGMEFLQAYWLGKD